MLTKDPARRPSVEQLLEHEFVVGAEAYKEEFAQVVNQHIEVKKARSKRRQTKIT